MEHPDPSPRAQPAASEAGEPEVMRRAAPRAVGPAALRAVLYVIAWFFFVNATQIAALLLVVGGIAVATGRPEVFQQLEPQGNLLPPPWILAVASFVGLLATLAVTAFFVHVVDRRPLRSLGFRLFPGWGAHWLAGFGIEGLHMGLLFGLGVALGWYEVAGAASLLRAATILAVALAIALPAAAIEEIAMRGYVQQTLEAQHGPLLAALANSVVFALLHASNPGGLQPLAVAGLLAAGLYLTVAYLATRQLWFPIALHAAWNLFEGPVFGLPVSGYAMPESLLRTESAGPPLWTGGAFGPEGGLLALGTTGLFSLVVWQVGRRLPRPPLPGA